MTKAEPTNPRTAETLSESARLSTDKKDYLIGYARPPVETRFQPGRSGNPKGRPKGRRNLTTELEEIYSAQVTFNEGDKARKISLPAANLLAHGMKGAKGNVQSSKFFLEAGHEMGLVKLEDVAQAQRNDLLAATQNQARPGDQLICNLDRGLLSRQDMIELSRLAEKIDLGGDITALSTADFELLKSLVDKGRGRDVTRQ